MPDLIERARRYVAKMPGGVSGSNRHSATFHAAFVLVHGFGLSESDAWPILQEFNERCDPPSAEHKLLHRLKRAVTAPCEKAGWLASRGAMGGAREFSPPKANTPPSKIYELEIKKPEFDEAALRTFAGAWAGRIDLLWLAARSTEDPCTVSSAEFLQRLYLPNEKIVVFTEEFTQGQAVFEIKKEELRSKNEEAELPAGGPKGVWFLAQPVDGKFYPNPRSVDRVTGKPQMSRRSEESVTAFRYFVVESDKARVTLWLAALVQLPLRIAAIYSSGGRSVHALVRVDARTKSEWDGEKLAMKQALVTLGADPGAMSAVRLTRLPGCWRGAAAPPPIKSYELRSKKGPQLQKLLYINPQPQLRPLTELMPRREVLKPWLEWAARGVSDADETGGEALTRALSYYAPVSAEAATALKKTTR